MQTRALFMVAKRPAAGQTKTRLCPPLTASVAAELYGCFLRDSIEILRDVVGVERTIAYYPAAAAPFFHALAPDLARVPQVGDGLGERLDHLMTDALARGASQVVVMSSDSPTLPAAYVTAAFAALAGGHDVVLGPSDDGGYYLIGVVAPQPRLLREVPMSTPTVLHDTLALAATLGLRVALLPPWYDIDTATDLSRLRTELAAQALAGQIRAPHTAAFLRVTDPGSEGEQCASR
jgi:uncharacterized protein